MNDDELTLVSKALQKAWLLGQLYWQRADSDSWKQNRLANETADSFYQLRSDTLDALRKAQ